MIYHANIAPTFVYGRRTSRASRMCRLASLHVAARACHLRLSRPTCEQILQMTLAQFDRLRARMRDTELLSMPNAQLRTASQDTAARCYRTTPTPVLALYIDLFSISVTMYLEPSRARASKRLSMPNCISRDTAVETQKPQDAKHQPRPHSQHRYHSTFVLTLPVYSVGCMQQQDSMAMAFQWFRCDDPAGPAFPANAALHTVLHRSTGIINFRPPTWPV